MKPTNDEPKHTQGEWIADGLYIMSVESRKQIGQTYLMNFNHDTYGKSIKDIEGIANAQRIVKAVNMHDELIKTIEMCNSLLKAQYGEGFQEWVESKEIERILNKAEQK